MFNNKNLKQIRKNLRYNQSHSEKLLWSQLRNKGLLGYKFFRQFSINNYILDFYSPKLKINIELDGGQHNYDKKQKLKDEIRDKLLNELNIKVLRFSNRDILINIQGVLMKIAEKIQNSSQPPLWKRGGVNHKSLIPPSFLKRGLGGVIFPLHIVYGPTASGKTELAIKLAREIGGELISADSRQIYKFMDIGTNKEVDKLSQKNDEWYIDGIPIHLINIITPDQTYSVAEYQKVAYKLIDQIIQKGKIPILVGGTGLYIDAVAKGYEINDSIIDPVLRKELNELSVEKLQKRLQKLNQDMFEKMNESDRANPRRLIRAIEKNISPVRAEYLLPEGSENILPLRPNQPPIFNLHWHSTQYDRSTLMDKINARVIQMIDDGLIEETQRLLDMGYDFSLPAMNTMGYKEAGELIRNEISKEEMIAKIRQAHRNYAKRQITWFKKYAN